MRRVSLDVVAVLVLVVLSVLAAAPATAHTQLVAASPRAGPPLGTAPPTVSLSFSDPVIGELSRVRVRGPDGRDHVVGAPSVLGGTLQARLGGLDASGTYEVDFRVVGVDGHPVSGSWHFTLTAAAIQGAARLPAGADGPAATLAGLGPSVDPATLALLLLILGVAATLVVRRVVLAVHRTER